MNRLVQSVLLFALLQMVGLIQTGTVFACGAQGGPQQDYASQDCQSPVLHSHQGPDTSTANPVDLITGNKFLQQFDAPLAGGLSVARFYNSRHDFGGVLGPGWRHVFEFSLSVRRSRENSEHYVAQVVQGDGRRIVFQAPEPNNYAAFIAVDAAYGSLRHFPQLGADRRWQWRWRDGTRLYFSDRQQLTAAHAANGHRLDFKYDRHDRLVRVINRHGSLLRMHYGSQRYGARRRVRLRAVTLPDGQVLRYSFDKNGVLESVTINKVQQWRFEYADDRFAALTRVFDGEGLLRRSIRYTADGRVAFSALGKNLNAVSFDYRLPAGPNDTGETRVTSVGADGQGASYRWRYQPSIERRQWLSATGPGCAVCPPVDHSNHYDEHGRLIRQEFERGLSLTRAYDRLGRLSELHIKRRELSVAITKVGYRGQTNSGAARADTRIQYQYQSDQVDAPLVQVSFNSVAPGKRLVRRFEYDSLARLTGIVEQGHEPDPAALVPAATGWRVDAWRPITRRWSLGWVDFGAAVGLPAWIDGPLPGLRDKQLYVYNRRGLKIARFGPYRRKAVWAYGPNDLPSRQTIEGETSVFEYDQRQRVTRRGLQDAPIHITYNPRGDQVALAVSGMPTLGMRYDQAGRMAALFALDQPALALPVDKPLHTRRVRRTDAGSLPLGLLARFGRQRGDRFVVKPSSGEWQQIISDDFGRVNARFDSEHGHIRWFYDLANRPLVRLRTGVAPEWFRYSPNGRMAGVVQSGGRSWQQTWRGRRVVARRDLVSRRHWRISASGQPLEARYHYRDPVTGQGFDRALSLTRHYDQHQRLIMRDLGHGWRVRFAWSEHNRLTSLSLEKADSSAASAAQQPIALADDLQWLPLTNGQRGLLGGRWGNGINHSIEYTSDNRPLRLSWRRHDQSGAAVDIVGPVVRGFDQYGRVISRTRANQKERFDYNQNGSLKTASGGFSGAGMQVMSARQSHSLPIPASQPGLMRRATGAIVMLDRNGRPRWSADQTRRAYRYLYNSDGERIGRLRIDKPQQSRWFIYENKRLHSETDARGRPLQSYIYLDGKPFVMIRFNGADPVIHWIHTDARGLPIAMTNHQGEVVWRHYFDAFGRWQSSGKALGKPDALAIRLPGQYVDAETGLHDNYKRTYDPESRRYTGPDPLGLRQNGQRYAYAGNSPLDTIDPLGLYEQDVHYYATLVIAVAAGMSVDDAVVIANASQFVDDSQETEPIITNADGSLNLTETFLSRRRVLEQHHFVLDANPSDGRDVTQVSNPSSYRLTQMRAAVDSSGAREQQMFNLGVFAHAFTDTAAHRDQNNLPFRVPLFPGPGGIDTAIGHGIEGHYPDLTFNTCAEPGPDGELGPTDPDLIGARRHWPNNEARTLTIQRDLYEVFRQYSTEQAAISWEELAPMLARFNAIEESATHVHQQLYNADGEAVAWHSAEGVAVRRDMRRASDLSDFSGKLEQLNSVLNRIAQDAAVDRPESPIPSSLPLYDMTQALAQWETHFRDQ